MAEGGETASSTSHPSSSSSSSMEDKLKQSQSPGFPSFPLYPNGDFQMFPIMYPAMLPAFANNNPLQNQQQDSNGRGAGIYAVPVPSFMGPIAGLPSNTLIPLTFNLPTRRSTEVGATGDQGQGGGQPQQQQQQQPAPQRQIVVRRFQIAFQLDLLLILKLAAVIFLFNQEGSRQRLVVLVLLASLVYFYQTGALAPLVRWLSQSMQRAAAPPRPPRPAVRAENPPAAARQNENVAFAAEGQAGVENLNQPAPDAHQAAENENIAEPVGDNGGNHWWGIVKEIQMIVFGFITSLLPGFHNMD